MENHKANIVNPEENDIIAIYESAVGLEQSGDYHGAIAAYNRVIEIDSSYVISLSIVFFAIRGVFFFSQEALF